MNHQQRSLRVGAVAIVCAIILKLGLGGFFRPVADFLTRPSISSLMIYLETGRIVRFSTSSEGILLFASESAAPVFEMTEEAALPAFSTEDVAAISVKYFSTKKVNLEELMARPLVWDLAAEEPTVLILHTHGTESYTKSEGEAYTESSAYRTLDEGYNMISVGVQHDFRGGLPDGGFGRGGNWGGP